MRISDWSSDVCSSDLPTPSPPSSATPTSSSPSPRRVARASTACSSASFRACRGAACGAGRTRACAWPPHEHGRESSRERVGRDVLIWVVAETLTKKVEKRDCDIRHIKKKEYCY